MCSAVNSPGVSAVVADTATVGTEDGGTRHSAAEDGDGPKMKTTKI